VREIRAATQQLKLSHITEFTTSCNFCSCGCGMIAAVRDGKLIAMEGGALYRAPGSDRWQDLDWKDAAERIARKIKKVRDEI